MDQSQQSVRLVTNKYRQQPPSITVNPVGDGADVDTAEILQGVIRHIEVNCDATVAYEQVHEGMVRTGFHSLRLLNDYSDDDSEDQEIIVEPIRNAFSVFWQPGVPQHKAKWCFIIADIPTETYKTDYSSTQLAKMNTAEAFTATGNAPPSWITKEYIRVAEYFEIEEEEVKGKRPKRKVIWRKINAFEVIEGPTTLPGRQIPVFTAYGDDLDVNGKRFVAGLVRNAKGPQRQYNYMCSGATEAIALTTKAPWVIVEGQLSGAQQTQWEQSNNRNFAVLTYKQVDVAGKPAPPPQRNAVEPPIQGYAHMIGQASLDLKASLGIYDPSLGQRRGDESGKAIERLQAQGNVATLNYSDNMSRMMKRLGRCILEWIRDLYTEPKIQRIINPDGSVKHVVVHNGEDQEQKAQQMAEDAKIKNVYDIGTGRYDVVISVGPTYQSKRQEAVETGLEVLKVLPPQVAQNSMDLIVREMDTPWSKQLADRIKKMLPPQLQEGDEEDPQVQIQKLQAQLQQMGQQHDLLAKALTETTDQIKTKKVEADSKMQIAQMQEMTKQEIVKMQEATKLAVAQINASKDANQSFAENEITQYQIMHDAAHDIAMQKDQQAHEQQMGQQQAAQDQQSQQADQQHEAGMQASDQANQQQMAEQQAASQQEGGQ